MSVASEVYTKLGEQAVEAWTSLRNRYEEVKKEMSTVTDEKERDRLIQELTTLGRSINDIEEEAGICKTIRTS